MLLGHPIPSYINRAPWVIGGCECLVPMFYIKGFESNAKQEN